MHASGSLTTSQQRLPATSWQHIVGPLTMYIFATLNTVCLRLAPTAAGEGGPGLPSARSTVVGSSSTPSLRTVDGTTKYDGMAAAGSSGGTNGNSSSGSSGARLAYSPACLPVGPSSGSRRCEPVRRSTVSSIVMCEMRQQL